MSRSLPSTLFQNNKRLFYTLICLLLVDYYVAQAIYGLFVSTKNCVRHLGTGYLYGANIGCLVTFTTINHSGLKLSASTAIGFAEGGKDRNGNYFSWIGSAYRLVKEKGKNHKLSLGTHFFFQHTSTRFVNLERYFVSGWSLIRGYKLLCRSGILFEIYLGDIYVQKETATGSFYSQASHVELGVGMHYHLN